MSAIALSKLHPHLSAGEALMKERRKVGNLKNPFGKFEALRKRIINWQDFYGSIIIPKVITCQNIHLQERYKKRYTARFKSTSTTSQNSQTSQINLILSYVYHTSIIRLSQFYHTDREYSHW
jgi:hypothetical protein